VRIECSIRKEFLLGKETIFVGYKKIFARKKNQFLTNSKFANARQFLQLLHNMKLEKTAIAD